MIRVENLEKYYHYKKKNQMHVLQKINLIFPDRGLVCVTGESGCGKTSLLNAMSGLDSFQGGRVVYEGKHVLKYGSNRMEEYRNQNIGYIFQNYYLISDQTVEYNVALALKVFRLSDGEREKRIRETLEAVGMRRYRYKRIDELSGGQRQRVSIARALVKAPDIIFADEPTGNLDEENTIRVMQLLRAVSKQCLVILVSHEQKMVRGFADRIIRICDGKVASDEEQVPDGKVQWEDAKHIYLGEMKKETGSLGGIHLEVFSPQDGTVSLAPSIQMAWKDGKIYIQGTAQTEIVLAGETAGCALVEQKRLRCRVTEEILGFPWMESASGQAVQKTHGGGLTLRQSLEMAKTNLRSLGRKRIYWNLILGLACLLFFVVAVNLLQQHSIDRQAVQKTDSHLITLKMDSPSGYRTNKVTAAMEKFYEACLWEKGYRDLSVDTNAMVSLQYEGFPQLAGKLCRIDDFSVVSVQEIGQDDLECGRLPENRNEIVIDRWLLQRCRKEQNLLQELLPEDKQVLGSTVTMVHGGADMEVVGISDTEEPTVYVSDSVILGASYSGTRVMTMAELSALDPETYRGKTLEDKEILVSRELLAQQEGDEPEQALKELVEKKFGDDCSIAGYFDDHTEVDYIVSAKMLQKLVKNQVLQAGQCQVYAENPKKTLQEFQEIAAKTTTLKISVEYSSRKQLQAYQKEHHGTISVGYPVAALVIVLCVCLIYFLMRSCVQARREELSVYRLLGLKRANILTIYVMEAAWIALLVCAPLMLLGWGILRYITAIPSLEMYLYFPWWILLLMILGMVAVVAGISVLPLRGFLARRIKVDG